MTHDDARAIDVGLLNPVSAGRDDAASDARVLAALVEAEVALVRAYAAVAAPDASGAGAGPHGSGTSEAQGRGADQRGAIAGAAAASTGDGAVAGPDEAGAHATPSAAADGLGAPYAEGRESGGAGVPDDEGPTRGGADTAAAPASAEGAAASTEDATGAGLRAAASGAAGLRDVVIDPAQLARDAIAGGNPVISLVKALRAGAPAAVRPWVHRGATSQDILDTALMLVARDAAGQILADLDRVDAALAAFAERWRDTPAAGRTLTQHAVPTTVGLRAANWLRGVRRAAGRLREAREQLPAQLGGAGGTLAATVELFRGNDALRASAGGARPPAAASRDTAESASRGISDGSVQSLGDSAVPRHDATGATDSGAPVPGPGDPAPARDAAPAPEGPAHARALAAAVRDAYADALGLARTDAPWHTTRWPVTELGDALAQAIGALGVVAADVATLSRTEIGELAEPTGGGSSAMPQKQNPARSVLIRSAAIRAPQLAATLQLAAGIAVDERPDGAWHAEWPALRDLLRAALGAASHAAELAEGLRVDPDAVARTLGATGGLIVSERLSAVLGKERAAEIVAGVVAGGDLAGLVRAAGGDPDDLLDPARYTGLAGEFVDRVADN